MLAHLTDTERLIALIFVVVYSVLLAGFLLAVLRWKYRTGLWTQASPYEPWAREPLTWKVETWTPRDPGTHPPLRSSFQQGHDYQPGTIVRGRHLWTNRGDAA